MHDTHSGDFLRRQRNQVVAKLVRVKVSPLREDLLLLSNSDFKSPDPLQDVPVTSCQLVTLADLDELVQRIPILGMGHVE